MACLLPPQLYMNAQMENDGPKSGAEKKRRNRPKSRRAAELRKYGGNICPVWNLRPLDFTPSATTPLKPLRFNKIRR